MRNEGFVETRHALSSDQDANFPGHRVVRDYVETRHALSLRKRNRISKECYGSFFVTPPLGGGCLASEIPPLGGMTKDKSPKTLGFRGCAFRRPLFIKSTSATFASS